MHKIFFKFIQRFFFISFFINVHALTAQSFGYLNQKVDVSVHQNKAFKFSASIRKDTSDKYASTYLYLTLSNSLTKGKSLLFESTENMPVSKNWQTFTIDGTIDPTATSLLFGMTCMNHGKYFFDNFKLEIQNEDGVWEEISIINPSFEDNLDTKKPVWGNTSMDSNREFTAKITNENPNSGNYCLKIELKDFYGSNDENGAFVYVNGVKLYYEIYGEGSPLLLLHGAGQSINAFKDQIDFFSKHYKVIALDSRGRGRSTDNDEELTYVNQAKDVKEFLDELKLDAVDIIGWSDGGIIGLIFAMEHPEKVKKLVAMGANIHPDGLFPQRLKEHKETLKKLEIDEKSKKTINYKIYKQLINYPQLKFEDLKKIVSPTLIMAGDHDVITDLHTVKIFQSIPKANLAIFPSETHWFPAANPTLFNNTVFDFLQKDFKKPNRY
ncbi:alpha/beta hydrolase [Kordia sp. YSTF-M3]|uniref:Alpha/beta hydrolase n=1 Tax=Kordia aestuariivivens TaxID=2759037 RepID=A0ABR7Q937_9FLAO|nr:alpha/beta hydrolase [Kordia aestuariivivens]MBC8755072.1 alpha/beta hydrolase [Kordia aestuariivivens]